MDERNQPSAAEQARRMRQIDGHGGHHQRQIIRTLMRRHGADDRKAKAQAKRDRRASKRSHHIENEDEA